MGGVSWELWLLCSAVQAWQVGSGLMLRHSRLPEPCYQADA
jgi:hypothetical protein